MENYERYCGVTAEQYNKRSITSFFCRMPSDRRIFPLIRDIKGKKILDVGLGTGYYTRFLIEHNKVKGVDRNPHLCRLPVEVYEGDATELGRLVNDEKFDVVFSTWMTEYLSPEQLSLFFKEAKKVLNDRGQLMTTIVSKYGFGFIYVTLAKLLRGINKYNYSLKHVTTKLREAEFTGIEVIKLGSWLHVPWAYMVVAE